MGSCLSTALSHRPSSSSQVTPPMVQQYPQIQVTARTAIKINDTVELSEKNQGKRDGSFLRVRQIFLDISNGRVTLEGHVFSRTRELGGLISFQLNEVCLLAPDIISGNVDHILQQALQKVDLGSEIFFEDGEPVLRNLILTNEPFPRFSLHEEVEWDPQDVNADQLKQIISRNSQLVCRYIFASHQQDKEVEDGRLPKAADVINMPANVADPAYATPDWQLLSSYRGLTPANRSYTFADGFCGAGGVSAGASQAGLEATFAFDHNEEACQTYRLNRSSTTVWNADLNHFLGLSSSDEFRADIIHISPPCQAYSRNNCLAGLRDPNSEGGRRDDANQASSFGIQELIMQVKPRIVTVEQTSGILDPRCVDYFRGMIRQFTDQGYSVSWRLVDLAFYGCPQHRKRVIIIASCPGVALPPFPDPTHGPGTGRPFRTIKDCISCIDASHENHNPNWSDIGPTSSGDILLTALIATGGTINRHPSGRPYTIRELAALMTLPLDFRFAPHLTDSAIKRQIGNMVPACFAETLMRSVVSSLRVEDQEIAAAKQLADELSCIEIGDNEKLPIVIDDDAEDSDSTVG